jgi:hypothetical protein
VSNYFVWGAEFLPLHDSKNRGKKIKKSIATHTMDFCEMKCTKVAKFPREFYFIFLEITIFRQ